MNFDFQALNDSEKELLNQKEAGLLRIEVPHWAAQVQIYDHLFQPVETVGMVKTGGTNNVSQTVLAQGTYQVEVTLDGKTETEWIPVRANRVTQTTQLESWNDMTLVAAAPLAETYTKRESHTLPAEEWSRKLTWLKAPGGASRLFLFVRTLQPQKYPKFYDGLLLLDPSGRLVTDFNEGVKINKNQGWLAFNADLPPGGYILRRGRRGVRVRHQPIYLCPDHETQLFLISESFPALSNLTLNIGARGRGFQSDDETALAAEAVFSSLKTGTSHLQIAMSDKIERLLEEKFENPWLGIVAAYALLLAREIGSPVAHVTSKTNFNNPVVIDRLFNKVLNFLQNEIGDHPDVLALSLLENEPPPPHQSFPFPPLLWRGVKRVFAHSMRFTETIPVGSLTDCLLNNLLTDSPWTSWRRLDRLPEFGENPEFNTGEKKSSLLRVKEAVKSKPLLQNPTPPNAPLKAPVFQLPDAVSEGDEEALWLNYLLKQHIVELTESGEIDNLPPKIFFDSRQRLNDLIWSVSPLAVSEACGLPLSRVESSFTNLQNIDFVASTETPKQEDVSIVQAAIRTVSQESKQQRKYPTGQEKIFDEQKLSAVKCADKIRIEAEQLIAGQKKNKEKANPETQALAKRLFRLVEKLLRPAEFAALTLPKGGLFTVNVAFLNLLTLPDETNLNKPKKIESTRKKKQRLWEKALAKTTVGQHPLSVQPENGFFTGQLRRTAINNPASNTIWVYLNLFANYNSPLLAAPVLQTVTELTSNLSLYATLYNFGDNERNDEYLQELLRLTDQLETLIGV